MTNFDLATVSKDTLKAIYGAADDVVLYWAHHEKLLVIDRNLVFMGGLDMCMFAPFCYSSLSSNIRVSLTSFFRLWTMGHQL